MTNPQSDGQVSGGRTPRFLSAPFAVCGLVLAIAAVGIRPALAALIDAWSKESIELRKKLDQFPQEDLASFRFLRDDSGMEWLSDLEELGTTDMVAYSYAPKAEDAGIDEAMTFITYYSDPRETIPHTPEVCYRQAGATIRSMRTDIIETPELAPTLERVKTQVLDIEYRDYNITLVYVLSVNGRVVPDRMRARLWIGLSPDEYVYFSKLEVVHSRERFDEFEPTVEPCKQLLVEALAILVRDHYPTREDLRRR